jgi:hypothetical protein
MTIEQRPELNRLVDPSFNWNWRWRQYKTALPVVCFFFLCVAEIAVIDGWLADKPMFDAGPTILAGATFAFLLIWGILELQIFFYCRCKRILQIEDDRIYFRSGDRFSLRWKQITQFQFEPVADPSGLTKLRVRGFGAEWPRKERQRWAMIVERPAQVRDIIRCLEINRTTEKTNFEISILEKPPASPPAKPFSYLGRLLNLGGVYLLLHGILLLCVALGLAQRHPDETSKTVSTARVAWEYFVLRHFSSAEQFQRLLFCIAIGLIVAGVVLLILGRRLMKRKTPTGRP